MKSEKLTILAIDDQQDNLTMLKTILADALPNAVLLTALDGPQGLARARSGNPDVILLNIVMPEIDGFDLCKKLKADKDLCDIPVVFITAGSSDRQHRMLALDCGAEAFLAKPIDESELTAQILAMLKIKTANVEKRTENERLAILVGEQTCELKKAHAITSALLETLKQEKEYFERMFNTSPDAALVTRLSDGRIVDVNEGFVKLSGYTRKEAIGNNSQDMDLYGSREDRDRILGELDEKGHCDSVEAVFRCKDGHLLIGLISAGIVMLNSAQYVSISIRDITERKEMEENLVHMSFHDHLTELYNRRFFEEELKRLDTKRNLPMTVAMGDVNGLKLINDSFGHVAGDDLLKKVAEVMRKSCRSDDIIARLGGDEFGIFLPRTDAVGAEIIIQRIRELLSREKSGSMDISISFGYETKFLEGDSLHDVLRNAEDHMYRHKLHESSSMRSKTIDLVMNTLFEKSSREMMHSGRVGELCESIALELYLEPDEVKVLKTAGLMHDIGKIGISDQILNKPQKLSSDEWSEIKKHPDIGFRILSSVNEFSEIVQDVLEHHERWDGKGYPKGLAGEQILLHARVIAIADAYDAMTSYRTYGTALSEKDAVEEIKRCSGFQFDPEIARVFVEKVLKKPWE